MLKRCEQLVHAFITSMIDCCNSLLYCLSSLINFSVYKTWQHVSFSALLYHSVFFKFSVFYPALLACAIWNLKICLLSFKAIHGSVTGYLRELVEVKENRYRLIKICNLKLTFAFHAETNHK